MMRPSEPREHVLRVVESLYPSGDRGLPGVRTSAVAAELDISPDATRRHLEALTEEGRLERRDGVRGYRYHPRDDTHDAEGV